MDTACDGSAVGPATFNFETSLYLSGIWAKLVEQNANAQVRGH